MVDTDDTRRTTNDGRRTMPRVWHKLPTGELKTTNFLSSNKIFEATQGEGRVKGQKADTNR